MAKGTICCDSTLIFNLKDCKLKNYILKAAEKYLQGCKLAVLGFEIKDERTRNLVFEDLNQIFIVELLPSLKAYRFFSPKEFEMLSNVYPNLDKGERILIAYALALKRNGENICLLSDDKKARKAAKELGLLPCCIRGYAIGGSVGIINALILTSNGKRKRKKVGTRMIDNLRQKGNRIPMNLIGKNLERCDNNHC